MSRVVLHAFKYPNDLGPVYNGGGGPQVGEVTRLGGATRQSI